MPYFFTKVNVIYSEPIYVNANLNYDETSALIINCENKLNELQLKAQEF